MNALLKFAPVVGHTLTLYLFLIFAIRLGGRRQLGQLSVIDLVIILILGSAVETAMIGGDVSLPAGLISAATLLIANRLLALAVRRFTRLYYAFAGNPVLIIHDGQLVQENMRRAGLTEADVMEAIREREYCELKDVNYAVMEADGEINVIGKDAAVKRTPKEKAPIAPAENA